MRLVLASASPRRAELLTAAGYRFDVRATGVDESTREGESPREYVLRVARDKATAAERAEGEGRREGPAEAGPYNAGRYGAGREGPAKSGPYDAGIVVLAADTTVVVDGEILGKPLDDEDARGMLQRLSGRAHEVLTGVAVRLDDRERSVVESTIVWFKPLTDSEIAWYTASGEGRDKAGAYAIQGLASRFIPRIEGSYSNVVGLPVEAVHRILGELLDGAGRSVELSKFG